MVRQVLRLRGGEEAVAGVGILVEAVVGVRRRGLEVVRDEEAVPLLLEAVLEPRGLPGRSFGDERLDPLVEAPRGVEAELGAEVQERLPLAARLARELVLEDRGVSLRVVVASNERAELLLEPRDGSPDPVLGRRRDSKLDPIKEPIKEIRSAWQASTCRRRSLLRELRAPGYAPSEGHRERAKTRATPLRGNKPMGHFAFLNRLVDCATLSSPGYKDYRPCSGNTKEDDGLFTRLFSKKTAVVKVR